MKRVYFPHPLGIVISDACEIGNDVVIYQNVTIGRKSKSEQNGHPKIEDNVIIYPGAVLYGPITIGPNSIIGANATVSKDVPPSTVIVGHNIIKSRNVTQYC